MWKQETGKLTPQTVKAPLGDVCPLPFPDQYGAGFTDHRSLRWPWVMAMRHRKGKLHYCSEHPGAMRTPDSHPLSTDTQIYCNSN